MSIVFFGSGPVAAESLRLLNQSFTIEAVITRPTTEHQMRAVSGDAPVHTVSTKAELDTLFEEEQLPNTVGVLIDFGIIVSQNIINYFNRGIVNSHFSLLPELRGADPISFAILEGRDHTGVSLMLLVEAMDEGPLLGYGELPLTGNETTPSLTDDLIQLSYSLLSSLLEDYVSGDIVPAPQSGEATYTRKLTKNDGLIDWKKSANTIEREIRAYADWPKSRATLGNIDCIITKATTLNHAGTPGDLFINDKKIAVHCDGNALIIETLKPAGKKEMASQAFLAGYKDRLGL